MSNVVHLNIVPKATAYDQGEDNSDPHTKAVRMFKEAFQYARKHCGVTWTTNLLLASLAIEDSNGWRERAREAFKAEKKNV